VNAGQQAGDDKSIPHGFETWHAYWTARGMPWRTEPEIGGERQRFLAERRAVKPEVAQGVYPFRDENGSVKLDRADAEWLLATHESGGMRGPVACDHDYDHDYDHDRDRKQQRQRWGLDVRGADLQGADVSALPLAHTRAGLTEAEARTATVAQVRLASVHLEQANLRATHLCGAGLAWARLDGADLTQADLTGANLFAAHLEGANLTAAQLAGANLENAFFDGSTYLSHTAVSTRTDGAFVVADVRWAGVNLARVEWAQLQMLGDERRARQRQTPAGHAKTRQAHLADYRSAVRANLQLALALRGQGLNELADRFTYRAQVLQRAVLRRQGQYGRWLFSLLLAVLSGYGYRLGRMLAAYAIVLVAFAAAYYVGGAMLGPRMEWYQAVLVSFTAIHGRVFFEQFGLNSVLSWVAATESVVGLVIEGVLVAMLVQRFFGGR
jgi:uncharacterized protein YjbI with pentapeptide repeats